MLPVLSVGFISTRVMAGSYADGKIEKTLTPTERTRVKCGNTQIVGFLVLTSPLSQAKFNEWHCPEHPSRSKRIFDQIYPTVSSAPSGHLLHGCLP